MMLVYTTRLSCHIRVIHITQQIVLPPPHCKSVLNTFIYSDRIEPSRSGHAVDDLPCQAVQE